MWVNTHKIQTTEIKTWANTHEITWANTHETPNRNVSSRENSLKAPMGFIPWANTHEDVVKETLVAHFPTGEAVVK